MLATHVPRKYKNGKNTCIISQLKMIFKALISEVKEACRAKIATVRQDLKQIADRVEALEEEHNSTRRYISQIQQNITSIFVCTLRILIIRVARITSELGDLQKLKKRKIYLHFLSLFLIISLRSHHLSGSSWTDRTESYAPKKPQVPHEM